ncbi:MAG TPA: hypothetical protein VF407_06655 [Polyangiaceae bacterium]
MSSESSKFSRVSAILMLTGASFAAACEVGCSGEDPPAQAATTTSDTPPEDYPDPEDDDGGGVVHEVAPDPSDDGGEEDDAGPPTMIDGCAVLAFPSGIHLQTFKDAKSTSAYSSISDKGSYPLPECFIDTNDLHDPVANKDYDVDVMVGKHFALKELVGTELAYGHFMLVSPTLIKKLDAYRDGLGEAVNLSSGYRSPAHQRATCRSICGKDSCGNVCAARSRHSWGDAADQGIAPSAHLADVACDAKFNFVYREGNHMHLDLNPDHKICTVNIL